MHTVKENLTKLLLHPGFILLALLLHFSQSLQSKTNRGKSPTQPLLPREMYAEISFIFIITVLHLRLFQS